MHMISPDGETVFRQSCNDGNIIPKEGEMVIPPKSEEQFRVSSVEHVFSAATDVDDEDVFDHDIYVEMEDPSTSPSE